MSYYLPDETTKAIEKYVRTCKNLGLILDKYPTKLSFEKPTKDDKRKGKTAWLLSILEPENPDDTTQNNHIDPQLALNAYDRWMNMGRAMGAELFSAELDWRMVVGLGGETVLETDLTLHHLYGIPYIPGSALKGLTRAYVTSELEGYKSEKIENDNKELEEIFGSQKRAGTVIFFDAMPIDGNATFTLDIMNPHYPKYYGEKAPPTNDQDPNPVTFLTVASTKFMFAIAPRHSQALSDVNKAKEWLQEALQHYGVGGKTGAGYGYFKIQPPYVRPNIPNFSVGAEIRGVVIDERNDPFVAQYIQTGKASKGLRYQPFSPKEVLILIEATYEETKNWKTNNISICQFIEEREEDGCTLLICKPRKR